MEYAEKKSLFITSAIGILFLVFFYVICKYQWNEGYLSLNEINSINVLKRFIQDFITAIGISMLNEIGAGIVGGFLFIACMELSGNILVAILIHSY